MSSAKGIAASVLLIFGSSAIPAEETLNKVELTALVSGNTVHFNAVASGVAGRAYHDKSGRILVDRDNGGTFEGLWSVQANGKLCMIVSNEICSTVTKNADGTYTRRTDGGETYRWTKITPRKGF